MKVARGLGIVFGPVALFALAGGIVSSAETHKTDYAKEGHSNAEVVAFFRNEVKADNILLKSDVTYVFRNCNADWSDGRLAPETEACIADGIKNIPEAKMDWTPFGILSLLWLGAGAVVAVSQDEYNLLP
jgi:hypothetical protein